MQMNATDVYDDDYDNIFIFISVAATGMCRH